MPSQVHALRPSPTSQLFLVCSSVRVYNLSGILLEVRRQRGCPERGYTERGGKSLANNALVSFTNCYQTFAARGTVQGRRLCQERGVSTSGSRSDIYRRFKEWIRHFRAVGGCSAHSFETSIFWTVCNPESVSRTCTNRICRNALPGIPSVSLDADRGTPRGLFLRWPCPPA